VWIDDGSAAAIGEAKGDPRCGTNRGVVAELLIFAGDFERADRQLEAVLDEDPRRSVNVATLRQLLRAETWRRDTFASGRLPELLTEPDEEVRSRLEALLCLREGDGDRAARLLARADEVRPRPKGSVDGESLDDFRDLDDRFGGMLEILTTTGKYFWVPIARIASLAFEPSTSLRDLLWRAARIEVRGGPEGVVYVPCVYPLSGDESVEARLGRTTDWRGGDGAPVVGEGQRMFLAGERGLGIFELTSVELG